MRILVTGGCGYVGSVLVPRLLANGHEVVAFDTLWFGCRLPNSPRLKVIKGDIRDLRPITAVLKNMDAVIHLAAVANDPTAELDHAFTKSINLDAFDSLVIAAKMAGVNRFIYCSTSSVYGISNSPEVTEDSPCVPITLYNRYKAECEPILWDYASDDFTCTILRPATVAGYSPRQRLDLCVNILTNHAVNRNQITVFGGDQMRPNIHIEDLVDVYQLLLEVPHRKIHKEIFNVTCHYDTITNWAKAVKRIVDHELKTNVKIVTTPSDDTRSYRVNADKIEQVLGYKPKRNIDMAIKDLIRAFNNHLLPNSLEDPQYYDVEVMKRMGIGTTPRHDLDYGTPAGAFGASIST